MKTKTLLSTVECPNPQAMQSLYFLFQDRVWNKAAYKEIWARMWSSSYVNCHMSNGKLENKG